MQRLLLADDDIELCQLLGEFLTQEGFEIDVTHDGESAIEKALNNEYDLMVLDVMMPKMNGFDVLRELRPQSQLPVLMLTARVEDVDNIIGLELGADDYLAKPCSPRVLVAHIRAILRRKAMHENEKHLESQDTTLKVGDLEMQLGARSVSCKDKHMIMTSTEYDVLEVLVREAGNVVSKEELTEQALGRKLTQHDRSIDMHVSNLRKKLGPLANGRERIQTVRGVGYLYTRD
jgi:two-component system response regulator CpxR